MQMLKKLFSQIAADNCGEKPWKFLTFKQDGNGSWEQHKETLMTIDGNGEMSVKINEHYGAIVGQRNGVYCANSLYCGRG